ncbi:MAG: protocatechuate 4,5-dioxygenase subunit alpha [Actinomycetales bacterium]|nr:protocatechuate 4,5-dioxygenase subunit alpha [Actinomycetales bacterium]
MTKPDFRQFDDLPGTTIFTIEKAREGYELNQFCMSLRTAENREKFLADERAYLDGFPMTEAQKQAVLDRDFQAMLDNGGNVYFLSKIFASEGKSYVQAVSTMTDLNVEQYQAMMIAGGRNIDDGWRSQAERAAFEAAGGTDRNAPAGSQSTTAESTEGEDA